MSPRLSREDKSVEIFFDSQRKGRKSVAVIAAGASLARLYADPSYSTPREKVEPDVFSCLMKFVWYVAMVLVRLPPDAKFPSALCTGMPILRNAMMLMAIKPTTIPVRIL